MFRVYILLFSPSLIHTLDLIPFLILIPESRFLFPNRLFLLAIYIAAYALPFTLYGGSNLITWGVRAVATFNK